MEDQSPDKNDLAEFSRRQVLGFAGSATALSVGGWWIATRIFGSRHNPVEDPPDEIENVTFTTGNAVESELIEEIERPNQPPVVRFRTPRADMEIAGVFLSGDSNCYETVVDEITYEESNESIEIEISQMNIQGFLDKLRGEGCSAVGRPIPYHITLTFETSIPTSLTAVEKSGDNEFSTTSERS